MVTFCRLLVSRIQLRTDSEKGEWARSPLTENSRPDEAKRGERTVRVYSQFRRLKIKTKVREETRALVLHARTKHYPCTCAPRAAPAVTCTVA